MKKYDRYSAQVISSPRWKVVRLLAKRRDGFQCVKCGAAGRLEVDHIKSVRLAPDLAFDLANLQTLCKPCHSAKTKIEVGFAPIDPRRQEWRDFVRALAHPKPKESLCLPL
ncbi:MULTISPECIES: HNH endonuclease signature motif containing protein [Rhodopseudomonas]|uniref:HNH endonuclease n=1 Tax=Rhodopseudomonas TaxID=1073 RepID=UPI0006987616|nr:MULTISPECIES: HNH endonuclease signature motif containing protein [Rhodopseudomonas]MDF3810082.1 HNH endonuclease signature motif containing protein [Rhodopseudomonas sp. BAL398]WOK18759.1 HNH endonuclease signature motif containing protein [Rhodopseudomonas sp. BAL398]